MGSLGKSNLLQRVHINWVKDLLQLFNLYTLVSNKVLSKTV